MERAIDTVVGVLEWFNGLMEDPDHVITQEEVERYFTSDAKMITNGQLKCEGIDAHLAHLRELQSKLPSFRIRMPLNESISTADEAAAYYQIDVVSAENGAPGIVHDSALWRVRDGKIALMVESVALEGENFDLALDNHS